MRADDAQAAYGFASECVKVLLKQQAEGDRAIVRSLENLAVAVASRPTF